MSIATPFPNEVPLTCPTPHEQETRYKKKKNHSKEDDDRVWKPTKSACD